MAAAANRAAGVQLQPGHAAPDHGGAAARSAGGAAAMS
jgi:hypothetical protein